MRDNGGLLIAHLNRRTSGEDVVDALAELYEVKKYDFTAVGTPSTATSVPYQVIQRSSGFLTTVEIYAGLDDLPVVPLSDAGFALHLSKKFGVDVAIPKPGSNWRWLVIHPDGSVSEGNEGNTDDNALEINDLEPVPSGTVEFR